VSLKTKARKSITITITIALILFSYNTWEDYKVKYKDSLRQVEVENVERLRVCRKPQNGYKVYECPNCKRRKYVPFTCKSRLCSSCGTKAANEWADKIYHRLLRVPHRHVVFTIPDKLWELFRIPSLQKILFEAARVTMEEMIKFSNKAEKRVKLKIGLIQVLQTYGADMKYDPHIHGIATEGGFDRKGNWIHVDYIPYEGWRKKWQYEVLTRLKKELPGGRETSIFINRLFKEYPEGFVVYGERRFENKEAWDLARYIGRYIRHPPIAEYRITAYDGNQVTFWYEDTKTKQKVTITMDKFKFIKRVLSHIPEKNFKIIRCCGVYSRRGYKKVQTEFTEGEEIIIKKKWREEILRTFRYDPLICPKCKIEMHLIEICYVGSETYPSEDPPPPEYHQYSQQERMQILATIIMENKNGRGANLEKVISLAVSKGIDREQVLNDIQHMKFHGYVYEPKIGEIAYV